ncbi:MAG: TetR/AcrR family transcriptional regulator [Gammaproteobacteria bacterium]|nr:MAG: TetR/AcrR family transcriptional regulator [Gammaproteobacteria bacterium]
MTTPRTTSSRYRQQHQRAIAAAATVFAQKGFHGATTQDIANEMGIQQGSLYYYFNSKEAALEEVCLLALRDYVSHMEALTAQAGSFVDKLGEAIHSHLASYRTHHEAMKVHNEQRLYLADARREQLKVLGSRYRELLEALFNDGVNDGILNPRLDCRFSARSLIGLCNYWGVMLLRDSHLELEDICSKCLELTLYGCLPHPEPHN